MTLPGNHQQDAVISYQTLRRFVGLIGILLPLVLAIGYILLEEPAIRWSISSYYHTIMGDVFVGALFAIGIFMLSYNGPKKEGAAAYGINPVALLLICSGYFILVGSPEENQSKPGHAA